MDIKICLKCRHSIQTIANKEKTIDCGILFLSQWVANTDLDNKVTSENDQFNMPSNCPQYKPGGSK